MSELSKLDMYIQLLHGMPSWNIHAVDQTGTVSPWYDVSTENVINDLVLKEHDLLLQVQTVAAQIAHWGRLKALAFRIWQMEDRARRTWKAAQFLTLYAPESPPTGWKKPSKEVVTSEIRLHPDYAVYYTRVERAEEAYNATDAVLSAFRAKKDLLKEYVLKQQNDKAPQLDII